MSRIYADIIVDISQEKLDKSFQYEIPEELQGQVEIGKRVRIPFGNGGRELTGYVIGLSEEPKIEPDRIKAILAVEDKGMEIESRLISLAGWIARQYGSTMNQALKTVLPVKEKEAAKEKRYLCLAAPEEVCIPFLEEYRRKHYKAKERLLQALMEKKTLEYTYAAAELKITASVIRGLEEKGLLKIERERDYRNPVSKGEDRKNLEISPLSPAQKEVCREIFAEWETSPSLSHKRGDGKRKNGSLHGTHYPCVGTRTAGHCADSGNCPDLSECVPVLSALWRLCVSDKFPAFQRGAF